MSTAPIPESPDSAYPPIEMEQLTKGDQNQTIGQAIGSIVVYVSGGQAIIHSPQSSTLSAQQTPAEIGPNPYKGLQAFQETDGDRFFGRETQIAQLWEKFRTLHEQADAVRVLPIYGPSGSGKSSLARAGLIPELARRPLPGCDRARVAVLVPGTHPLEALATVLARIVTQDLTPVAKTREFAGELAQANRNGAYDGLRRIADVLPEIALSPLIVLVDQFEEVYTLCRDQAERDQFIENLLCAASERSKRVSVIVTLRSDFLGETQKHPALNALFAEQGFLVRSMNQAELRQAIAKPAALAGHPLDSATIDLLIKDTEGREGALPLLQFALTRIWEGLLQQKEPAETLEAIGGVGGALAGEAQRIYDQLNPEEQEIARRVFLGLVQLGEGTKDTRRRVRFDSLVSYQNQPEQVKRVIQLFSARDARLITLAAVGNIETAEVTHEALFDHWRQLQIWLEGSRSDIRFQRRLDEAARYWEEQGRPEGNLWRPPDLDLLRQYQQRAGEDLTPLQMRFFEASWQAEENRKQKETQDQLFKDQAIKSQMQLLRSLGALFIAAVGLIIFAIYQLQQAQQQQVEQLAITAEALMATQPIDAEVNAIAAVGLAQPWFLRFPNYPMPASVQQSLLRAVQVTREQNRLLQDDEVHSVAFSPDGKTIVSGSWDKTVRLWDATTGQPIGQPLRGHENVVWSVAFSPDGKTIVSGSWDKTVRLWDAATGQPIGQPLRGHEDTVYSVAFSPDGKTIVSGSWDKTVRLWDAATGQPIGQPLRGHENEVYSVAFSLDGKQIVSGSRDSTVRLWDATTGEPIGQPLRGHEDAVYSVAFSPNGKWIASGSLDRTVRRWNVSMKQSIGQSLRGHGNAIKTVTFSPDGKRIVSGSWDKTLRLWDTTTGQPIGQPLRGHENEVFSVAFSPDGKQIISGSSDKTIRVWDASLEQSTGQPWYGHTNSILSVGFSPDGKRIVSGSLDKTVKIWNASTGEPIGKPLRGHEDVINSVALSPDGRTIVSGSWDKTVRLWDAVTGQPIGQPLRGHENHVWSVAFSPDSKTIVSGSLDKTMRLWDATTGQPIGQPLRGHEDAIRSVAFSPDGKWIASGSWDKTVRLWDATTGQPIGQPLRGHENEVYSVAFSPDGKQIVSGSNDKTVRLWDATTGQPIGQPLRGHENQVWSVAFSPDGKWIASSSRDKTVRLWDATTGQPIGQPLLGHENEVYSVAFSPDGNWIVSGGRDFTVRLWPVAWGVSWESLFQTVCEQLHHHSILTQPQTDLARKARQTCEQYAWSKQNN